MKRVSPTTLAMTALTLLLLWGASWGLSYVDLGAWSRFLAFGIAAAKAALVALFFMEIAIENVSVQATLVTGLTMIAILIFFMVADVQTRAAPPLLPPPVALSGH